jgi:hypothetical protein
MSSAGSTSSLRGGWAVLAAAATLLAASCVPGSVRTVAPARTGPVRVTGTLVAIAPPAPRSPRSPRSPEAGEIELADARVYLTDARGERAAEAVTRLDGHFEIIAPAAGRYRLCYQIGAARECTVEVRAAGAAVWLGSVAVAMRGVHGRVLTGDGRPCWISDSFFGLDVSTQVSARPAGAGGPPAASARANSDGEYALFGLPDGTYEMTASCEAARAVGIVRVTAAQGRVDFDLPNHAPVIRTAAAFAGTTGRTSAVVGETLAVRADVVDPEGDSIQYIWRGLPGTGLVAGGAAQVQWQLPATPGLVSAYLIARDGRGGYAFRRVDMEVGTNRRIVLSGVATDETTGRPISGALVTLGQGRETARPGRETTRTNDAGWFSLGVAPRDDRRYVVNIRHRDYALMSRVLDGSARGASYAMTAAQISEIRAGRRSSGDIMRIVDRASAGFCGAGGDGRERPLRRAALDVDRALGQSGELLRRRGGDEPCIRRGAEIDIPAGALEDSRGTAASGAVRVAVTTLNPARRALPGDYSAITRSRETVSLLSYGAVDAQFTDAAGQPLHLRDGASAEVRIPVPPSQAGSARATMAMWSYDEERGRWIEEGEAVLRQSADGPVYVGRTRHFSTINIDLPGWTAANVTCLRVELDPLNQGFSAWSDKVLRVYVNYGGSAVQVRETQLDSAPMHAIYTIPWGTSLPHNTVRLELRGTLNNTVYVLLERVIDTDARLQMNPTTDPFPPAPYDPCGVPITLTPPTPLIPYYGTDATGRPAFLTGPYGTFNPNPPRTAEYYAAVDNGNLRTNLGGWWQANDFDLNGQPTGAQPYAHAAYMNYNDLGFGRDMHCIERGGGKLACYVTNYGLPDQISQNADDAAGHNLATRGATVAMEYDPAGAANHTEVQFYVFGGGDQFAPRINFADLDGLGPKPVPNLCMVCHGGDLVDVDPSPTVETLMVQWARFREFDLPSFRYAGNQSWDFSQTTAPTNLDVAQFGQLNRMVHDIHPTLPIGDLIARWYPNGYAILPAQPNPRPPGWQLTAQTRLAYDNVYARSCRTCHLARDEGNPTNFRVFSSHADFTSGFVKNLVCGVPITPAPQRRRVMPNAYVTYRNFWADPNLPHDFEALYGTTTDCGS